MVSETVDVPHGADRAFDRTGGCRAADPRGGGHRGGRAIAANEEHIAVADLRPTGAKGLTNTDGMEMVASGASALRRQQERHNSAAGMGSMFGIFKVREGVATRGGRRPGWRQARSAPPLTAAPAQSGNRSMQRRSAKFPESEPGASARSSRREGLLTCPLLRCSVLVATLVAGAASAHSPGGTHDHTDFGEPGDLKAPARVVQVTMREEGGRMLFVPNRVEVRKGEQIRFVLTNEGMVNHEFVLGTPAEIDEHAKAMKKHPGMEHADAHSMTLGMYGSDELVWHFTKAGRFVFACLIPGHLERGMIGTVIVSDNKQ